jgi:hypothetical protein
VNVLTILRDLVCQAAELPDDQDSTPEEQAALLAGLNELVERHRVAARAKAVHTKMPLPIVRRTEVPPAISPVEGATFEILNVTANTYTYLPDAARQIEIPPGPSYVSGADPTAALQTQVDAGHLEIRPIALRSTDWVERLAAVKLAWERRAMCASRVGDADALRECLAHVNFNAKQQIQARLDRIAADRAALKNKQPAGARATRLRASQGHHS